MERDTRNPDVVGPSGKAYRFAVTVEERARKPHALDAYIIYQPGVHAFWSWWFLAGCDLYDDPDPTQFGKLPPKKDSSEKTHEFMCFAIDPKHFSCDLPPMGWDATVAIGDPESRVHRNIMKPSEFIHQEQLRDNDQANEILWLFVRAVCDGHTAADSDFRRRNVEMLAATAQHFRAGKHDAPA